MSRNGTCYSCGVTIRWVRLAPSFRPHPVDPEPTSKGTIHADDRGRATILPKDKLDAARANGVTLYASHFATCPHAGNMRRPLTPVPEPVSPVRTLVLSAEQAARVTPTPIPAPRGRERPLTEGEIAYLESLRASEAATPEPPPPPPAPKPEPAPACACPVHVPATAAPADAPTVCQRCVQLALELAELENKIDAYKTATVAQAVRDEQIGGEWLTHLRALRAPLAGATGAGPTAARAILKELADRMGYRLK